MATRRYRDTFLASDWSSAHSPGFWLAAWWPGLQPFKVQLHSQISRPLGMSGLDVKILITLWQQFLSWHLAISTLSNVCGYPCTTPRGGWGPLSWNIEWICDALWAGQIKIHSLKYFWISYPLKWCPDSTIYLPVWMMSGVWVVSRTPPPPTRDPYLEKE